MRHSVSFMSLFFEGGGKNYVDFLAFVVLNIRLVQRTICMRQLCSCPVIWTWLISVSQQSEGLADPDSFLVSIHCLHALQTTPYGNVLLLCLILNPLLTDDPLHRSFPTQAIPTTAVSDRYWAWIWYSRKVLFYLRSVMEPKLWPAHTRNPPLIPQTVEFSR